MKKKISILILTILVMFCAIFHFHILSFSSSLKKSNLRREETYTKTIPCYRLVSKERKTQLPRLGFPCIDIEAIPFDDQQWNLVEHNQKKLLQNPNALRSGFSSLTNNKSVNIFWNHVDMWRRVALLDEEALILEDDAIPMQNFMNKLSDILQNFHFEQFERRTAKSPGFVLKLHNNMDVNYLMSSKVVDNYECVCKISNFYQVSTMAYIMHPRAAVSLLKKFKTIETHVDLWLWEQGCIDKEILLFTTKNMVSPHNLPSIHVPNDGLREDIRFFLNSLEHIRLFLYSILVMPRNQDCEVEIDNAQIGGSSVESVVGFGVRSGSAMRDTRQYLENKP